jgi:hypothetical protein
MKTSFKDLRNMQILLFLLKVASYRAKQSYIIILTQTTQLT